MQALDSWLIANFSETEEFPSSTIPGRIMSVPLGIRYCCGKPFTFVPFPKCTCKQQQSYLNTGLFFNMKEEKNVALGSQEK